MVFDPVGKKVFKCEMCDGDPACAKFCEDGVIQYVESDVLTMQKKREAFQNLSALFDRYASRSGSALGNT
jgi:Fe-S-cluster-containing hydrogenase component 2